MPDLRPELRVSLEWRVAVWTHRATTEPGTIATIHMDDAVRDIAAYEPAADDGVVTREAVWELLVTFDAADAAIGSQYGWRAFILLDKPVEPPDDFRVVTGVAVP
jgi:hypothetical protein